MVFEQRNLEEVNNGPTLSDLVASHEVVAAKEQADGATLRAIGTTPTSAVKPALVEWYGKGCPPAFPILTLSITPPPRCSDGEVRTLSDYVTFCSGSPIQTHVAGLAARLPDLKVSFANLQGSIAIVVSRA